MKICSFDRNEFGVFKGTVTIEYERPEHAKKALEEYHGAYLDDKLLTVEYAPKRKTLVVGGRRK